VSAATLLRRFAATLDDFLEFALRVFRAATLRLADLVIVLAS
jgi:hypothetical protein